MNCEHVRAYPVDSYVSDDGNLSLSRTRWCPDCGALGRHPSQGDPPPRVETIYPRAIDFTAIGLRWTKPEKSKD